MAVDISGAFQRQVGDSGCWVAVASKFDFKRDRLLVGILAAPRDIEGLTPISPARGLPAGLTIKEDHYDLGSEGLVGTEQLDINLDCYSWLLGSEIVAWAELPRTNPEAIKSLGRLKYFVEEVYRLIQQHGNIRFVFGFAV
jgi:hypothetical protein